MSCCHHAGEVCGECAPSVVANLLERIEKLEAERDAAVADAGEPDLCLSKDIYTPQRCLRRAGHDGEHRGWIDRERDAAVAAVAAERERCCRIVEESATWEIAVNAIRATPEEPQARQVLECDCCGDVGAWAYNDGLFADGQELVCGCAGQVSIDLDGEAWISAGDCACGDEPEEPKP